MKTFSQIDATDPMPKYLQAEQILTEAIYSGKLKPGSKLPPTKEIGSMVNVSLITAQKALERLVEEGLLRREVGRGTYVCDDVAQAMAHNRRASVSLILDQRVNINDYYHSTIIDGLRTAARSDEDRVEFFFQDCDAIWRPRSRLPNGAICIHPPVEYEHEVQNLAQRIPVVVLGGRLPRCTAPYVDCDNVGGAREAVRHLVGLGHRRIVVLAGPQNLSNSRDRVDGTRAELTEQGLELADRDLIVSESSLSLSESITADLIYRLSKKDRPTAIIAAGFYLSLAVLQLVRRAGLDVPRDVSVVGFDDPQSAPLLDPPLTTVRQPLAKMADVALRIVRAMVDHSNGHVKSNNLPAELVVRGSTGPVF